MVEPQASRFWQAALQSGLIDVDGLNACWEALPREKRVLDQLERRLARQAVQSGRLTVWQAQQLLAGRCTGFKIDRYVLLEMIGQGGMGRVYLAKDTRLNRRVALKILSPERVNNPRAIARFQREARVGAQLQHEHLVRIYDEGESHGKCYLVMEYIQGKNIGTLIAEQGPLPPSTAARLTRQVALGLEHAQQKGLIHRDVNPYNILVTADGMAKLTDLGLAIDLAEQVPVTREGATVGTFDYISPEQARHSHSVDTRSDIYSLGCSIYHMLTGQVPFPSPSLPEKLFGHQAAEPEPLAALVPGIPAGLEAVVRKMMRKSPDDRYPNPLELALALEPFVDEAAPAYRDAATAAARNGPGTTGSTRSGTDVTAARRDPQPVTQLYPPPVPVPMSDPGAAVPPTLELSGLGPTLDLGPELSLTAGLSTARARDKGPAPPAAPLPAPPPAAPVDFANIGKEPAPKLDLSGLGLDLGLRPPPPAAGNPPDTRAKAPAAEPMPAANANAKAKVKATTQPSAPARNPSQADPGAGAGTKPPRRPDRRLVLGGAGVLGLIVVVGGLFASGVLVKPRPSRGARAGPEAAHSGKANQGDGLEGPGTLAARPDGGSSARGKGPRKPAGPMRFTIKAADGTLSSEPDLKGALQRAIGSRGHLLLDNRTPLRLSGADAAIKINGGPLYIRAADGARPVLEVEMKGTRPFLTIGAETPLTLTGVTIVAHYAEAGAKSGGTPPSPPLIDSTAAVTLERCAFSATGAVKGARAVATESRALTATGCWFRGFDTAVDVAAYSGTSIAIRQCMMVWARSDGPPAGFAVRVRNEPGGLAGAGRRLVLDRCTVEGRGLLDLVGFSPQMPLDATVKGCAVLADALLAWESDAPGTLPPDEALRWKGEGNQYDLRGKSWVVAAPQEGSPPIPGSPHDAATWSKLAPELAPIPPPVTFPADLAHLPAAPQPGDFALKPGPRPVGADPAQVGPAAPPSRKPAARSRPGRAAK